MLPLPVDHRLQATLFVERPSDELAAQEGGDGGDSDSEGLMGQLMQSVYKASSLFLTQPLSEANRGST